jgi:Leucine-rich repeat (LRR) protein
MQAAPGPLRLNRQELLRIFQGQNLQDLTDLDLRNMNIVSIDPDTFTGLDRLRTIRLDHNHIREIHSLTFVHLPNLEEIFLNFNNIQRLSPNSFNDLRSLRALQLSRNQIITIDNPNTFNDLRSLLLIKLNGNPLNLGQISAQAFQNVNPALDIEFGQQKRRLTVLVAPVAPVVPVVPIAPVALAPQCPICFNDSNRSMRCGHLICQDCYNIMPPSGVPNMKRCPICRAPAPQADLRPVYFNGGGYKEKYLKYKEKYLQLKNKL